MDEQKETQKENAEETQVKTEVQGKTERDIDRRKPTSIIEEAGQAAERLERANKELRELLERQELMIAEQKLGGRSFAGQQPEPVKEQTPEEYARSLMNGTFKLK